MKHASPSSLDRIEPLLENLRQENGLKEKKRGVFYRRSRAFLHFHEDAGEIYADVRLEGPDFDRFRCCTPDEQRDLLQRIRACLA